MNVFPTTVVLAIAIIVASPLHAQGSSPQPLTRAECENADQDWNDSTNVCGSSSEVSDSTSKADQPAAVGTAQPLTRAACQEAGFEWNDNTNVCGSSAAGSPGSINDVVSVETPGQPLTRSACDAAKMQWNESSNVCGTGSMPLAPQSASTEMAGQPLTRADCDKAGIEWDERTNVCGKSELMASTVKVAPVVASTPRGAKTAKTAKSKTANATKKRAKSQNAKRQTHTVRKTVSRKAQAAPAIPERRPFRRFRNRPAATQ